MNKKIVLPAILSFLLSATNTAFAAVGIAITNPLGTDNIFTLLTNIANAVGGLIASIGVVMIIVSGIMYATSAGSAEKMTKAKTTLIYAIIGIAIGIAASVIVSVVVSILSGK